MKKHRSSQFLAICTAAVLALSVPAWASQVSITPLDTGNTTSSQSQSGASEPSTAQNTSGQTVDISSITKPTVASQGAVDVYKRQEYDNSSCCCKGDPTSFYWFSFRPVIVKMQPLWCMILIPSSSGTMIGRAGILVWRHKYPSFHMLFHMLYKVFYRFCII